jgi:RraA family protein
MNDLSVFSAYSTCAYADFLTDDAHMDIGIRPLWTGGARLVGRAFTVKCEPGDNLMVHAAIYQAPADSILVIEAGEAHFAVAGGNVCATAAERGIAGFVIDGVIRDLAEIEEMAFPVYARGTVPKPGKKKRLGQMEVPVTCGGVTVNNGDIVVADEDGIVVIPAQDADTLLAKASAKADKESAQSLPDWQRDHQSKIETLVNELTQRGT